jgi:RHS repeat-associated protein
MLQRFVSTLDANGNRTAVALLGAAIATPGTESYTYDELDRLTGVTYSDGGSASYTWDANGNRLTQTSGGQTATYAYDDADQLTGVSGSINVTYSYDANGNRTAAGPDTFAYDWSDRLEEAMVGGTTIGYAYDGDDRRVSRTEGGVTADVLWDREGGLPTVVEDDQAAYVHGPSGLVEEVATGGSRTYALRDGLGSVRGRTDASGAVVGTSDYDVWGNPRGASGAGGTYGWVGEPVDADTGLVHLRARDYSPATGRFAGTDPVSPNGPGTQGFNAYAYALNNPATLTDPTGLVAGSGHGTATFSFRFTVTPRQGGLAAIGFSAVAISSYFAASGSPLTVLAAEILWLFAPVIAVVFGLAVLGFLLVQTVRYCQEVGCAAWDFAVDSVVKWAFKAGEVAKVSVEAVAEVAVKGHDPCDPVANTPMGSAPYFGPKPAGCEEDDEVCLYRAVELNEAADIERTGEFRTDPSGRNYEDGKWFASTCEDAITWGSKLNKEGFFVVESCCPRSFVDTLRYEPRWDAIGPAYYVTVDQLPIMNLMCRTRFKDGLFGT